MSSISQVQIRYAPLEDRLLMRLNTAERTEFRFWITRRFARQLATALHDLLAERQEVMAQAGGEARKAVLEFQHQEAIAKANFTQRFEGRPTQLPLGPNPVLLTRLKINRTIDGKPLLGLYPEQGRGIDLALQSTLLHSVCKLFADALQVADWQIEFDLPQFAGDGGGEDKPALLN